MASPEPYEPQVGPFVPIPPGYQFVPKGDVYITKNCRVKTHEAGKTLYVVVNKNKKTLGLRCPKKIFEAVAAEHKATATKRAEAVQKRDDAIYDKFEEVLADLFPKTPKELIPQILKHALQKRSGRVGRTSLVNLEEKVRLAVRAHIRHRHTDYDALLRAGESREAARSKISARINEVAKEWGAKPPVKHSGGFASNKQKKTATQGKRPRTVVPVSPRKVVPVAGKRTVAKKAVVNSGPRVQTRQIRKEATTGAGTMEEPFEILDSDVDVFSMSEDDTSDWSDWSNSGDSD